MSSRKSSKSTDKIEIISSRTLIVLITVYSLTSVDMAKCTAVVDFSVKVRWKAVPGEPDGWAPEMLVMNTVETPLTVDKSVSVSVNSDYPGFDRRLYWKMKAEVLQELDLSRFPFDEQALLLSIRVPRHLEQKVAKVVLIRPTVSFLKNFLNHSACTIASSSCIVEEQGAPAEANRKPTVVATITAQRESFYWVANVGVPLLIMNSISFAVFLLEPDMLAERLALVATVLLTVVTFKSALENRLPVINYLTLLDRWIVFLYCSLCIMALEAAVVHVIVKESGPHEHGMLYSPSVDALAPSAAAAAAVAERTSHALHFAKLIDIRTCLSLFGAFVWLSSVMINFPGMLAGKRAPTAPTMTAAASGGGDAAGTGDRDADTF